MTILIADDDRVFRHTVKQILEVKRGIDVVLEAENGEEAVELARTVQPDLVLMDLAMPRLSGLEATKLIKSKQPEIQVIMLSVHNDEIYRRAALSSGADAFFPKSDCWMGLGLNRVAWVDASDAPMPAPSAP